MRGNLEDNLMKTLTTIAICACLALAVNGVAAQEKKDEKKDESKPMTLQECKDYMAKAKDAKDAKKDDAAMKKEAACADLIKKEEAKK
jgi:hypothetical protein